MTTINDQFSYEGACLLKLKALAGEALLKHAENVYASIEGEVNDTPDLQQAIETAEETLKEIETAIAKWERENFS